MNGYGGIYGSCSAPCCEAYHRLIEQKFHLSHCQNFRVQLSTLVGETSFANFVADIDEHHAPIIVVEVRDRVEDKKAVRAILRLWCMLECLMVLAGNSPRTACEAGGQYFQMTRTDSRIVITVENDQLRFEFAVDPPNLFELAALLTAQLRRAMPVKARDHLPWLIDVVFSPQRNSSDAPNQRAGTGA